MNPFPLERVSLRAVTLGGVLLLGLVGVLLLGVAAYAMRQAAFDSQRKSLSRVVEVAAFEVMHQLERQVFNLGTGLQERPEFRGALNRKLLARDDATLRAVLQDPFVNGYVGAGHFDLVKLRVYDAELAPLEENASAMALAPGLSAALRTKAAGRAGADRLKAVSALWLSDGRPLYSVLLPVGGLKATGYLEVVVNPAFNLTGVARITRMPLAVYAMDGRRLHAAAGAAEPGGEPLEIAYELRADDGRPAFRLVCLEDVTQLRDDLRRTTAFLLAGVALLIVLCTAAAVAFFNRIIFRPLHAIRQGMVRCAEGDLSVSVDGRMVSEFRSLADGFNLMVRLLATRVEDLRRLSCIDSLTELSNRHHFNLALDLEWSRARRNGTLLALVMIDVDHFKRYNDHYGHLAGDSCLRSVARVLANAVRRPADVAARYGGEEFAILLPDTTIDGARQLAEGIQSELAALALPHEASLTAGRITVSIGVAACRVTEECKPPQLLAAADKALYQAKHGGRNRIELAAEGAAVPPPDGQGLM